MWLSFNTWFLRINVNMASKLRRRSSITAA